MRPCAARADLDFAAGGQAILSLSLLEGGNVFLRDTFRLRRGISATALDLWHVKGIVRALADGKTNLRGA